MIDDILNGCVKTASEFVGKALGYNNEQRQENITKKTERVLTGVLGGIKNIFDDVERDLDTIFVKNKSG